MSITDAITRIGKIRHTSSFKTRQSDTHTQDVLETLCQAIHAEPWAEKVLYVARDADGQREEIPRRTWLTSEGLEICLSGRWIKPVESRHSAFADSTPEDDRRCSVFVSCEFIARLEKDATAISATKLEDAEDLTMLRLNARDACRKWLQNEVFTGPRQTKQDVRDSAQYKFKKLTRTAFDQLWAENAPQKWIAGGRPGTRRSPSSTKT